MLINTLLPILWIEVYVHFYTRPLTYLHATTNLARIRVIGHCWGSSPTGEIEYGNSADKRSDVYSTEQVLLNKQQIWCGGAYLHCYL